MDKEELQTALGLVYDIMGSEQLGKSIGAMYANIVKELQKNGFSREEAISLAGSMNLGKH